MTRRALIAAVVAVVLVLGAQPAAADQKPSGEITVFAASSLTESFTALAEQFEERHPDAAVKLNFDSSSRLAAQIRQGAPADVFASADEANLRKVIDSGDVTAEPVTFASNRLEIAVEDGNPKEVKGLDDLGKDELVVVLCADPVPCGRYAAEAFAKADVAVSPASKEQSAKAALSKVSLGEADASVIYATDVKAEEDSLRGVEIPDPQNVIATYPIAVVEEGQNKVAAKSWVRFVRSKPAQRTLAKFGFLPP